MTELEEPNLPWAERPIWQYVECGEGWYGIITALDADLRAIYPDYHVVQVKEKFGGLRYYIDSVPADLRDAVYDRIRIAEGEASRTCEWCGQPGSAGSNRGWVITLCDPCRAKREARRAAANA